MHLHRLTGHAPNDLRAESDPAAEFSRPSQVRGEDPAQTNTGEVHAFLLIASND